ncbi:MAG: DUF4190 domain-containing protein [Planctomycetes bacterium]|nr:DUF4190 domain-containing protein [Planctomycetota bacterium]
MKNKSEPLNPWSFVAIVCSIGMCPFFTIAGVLLGVRALVDIKARPGTRGIRLAWAAIFIGSLVTGLWGGGMLWWNINVRGQMQHGAVNAIIEGESNKLDFLSYFTNQNQTEATEFIATLHSRYGNLISGKQVESTQVEGEELAFFMMPLQANLKYELHFTDAPEISATAKFVLFDKVDEGRQFTNKFAWICIHDEIRGDLTYPPHVVMDGENE